MAQSTQRTRIFDIAVVGRGAVGVACALALERLRLSVALVGPVAPTGVPRSASDWDARVFALSPPSRELLESVDAHRYLDDTRIAPVYDMRIWPRGGRSPGAELHFSAWQAGLDALAWIIENRNLTQALESSLAGSSVEIFPQAAVGLAHAGVPAQLHSSPSSSSSSSSSSSQTQADPPFAALTLADGTEVRARLVVGADGANSRVREWAGIEGSLTDYPQRAVVANFESSLPNRDCACQWFGEHGILALLPLPVDAQPLPEDGRLPVGRCSMVWSAPTELAQELLSLDAESLCRRIESVSGERLGRLRLLGAPVGLPLRLGRMQSLIAPRVALVGDAAHVVHPLAGQGMNLGFGDVAALASVLRAREPGRDPGAWMLLRRYERERAEPVAAMRTVTDGLQRLFDDHSALARGPFGPPIRALRGLGWRAVSSSGLIRRLLVSGAAR